MDFCPHCGSSLRSHGPTLVPEVIERWNKVAEEEGLPKVIKPASLAKKVAAMLKEEDDLDVIEEAFRIFARQDFIKQKRYSLGNFLPNREKYLVPAKDSGGAILNKYREALYALGGSPTMADINRVRRNFGFAELA